MSVRIQSVQCGSPCHRKGIRGGDMLLAINGNEIDDVLDYRFYATERDLTLSYRNAHGKTKRCRLRYDGGIDSLGLSFETYLMDKHRSCKNNCVFCFIDQLPRGMRKSLYFKDDDSRLSFLFGNYITLTGLTEKEITRIIAMHISPIHVSVHTMDPALRVQMMRNPHAGEALSVLKRFAEAGIRINAQLVLCPGLNDGEALTFSLERLAELSPSVQSIAAVPVGLTAHREGLYEIEPYTKEGAAEVIRRIERFNETLAEKGQARLAFAADEFYLKAEYPLPDAAYYGDFDQLTNGVGLLALLRHEFTQALGEATEPVAPHTLSVATGRAAYPLLCELSRLFMRRYPAVEIRVYCVENRFFGAHVTVAGLLTGQDLVYSLRESGFTGGRLLLASAMLKAADEPVFLDDYTVRDVEELLHAAIVPVGNNGRELFGAFCAVK